LAEGQWSGQVGIDHAEGGPFAIFGTAIMGWRALARNLLTYFEVHGLVTVEEICDRFAPPEDHNDTSTYTSIVAHIAAVSPTTTLELREAAQMDAVCRGIAVAEGGARLPWDASERAAGVKLALSGDS
jgi:hypothetical protein